jgi:hypothetical protein
MRLKLLAMGIALAFLAVPAQLAFAGEGCAPCCARSAQDAPCERGGSPCAFLGSPSCCEAAPVAPVAPALRSLDPPSAQPILTTPRPALPAARSARLLRMGAARATASLPLRLSVVLQI